MNYRNPQLIEELAAQYALGTLRGPARQRFEKLCLQDLSAMNALRRWEDRLAGLVSEVEPIKPPQHVWKNIQQRLGHTDKRRSGLLEALFGWMSGMRLATAAGVAAVVLAIGVVTFISIPQTEVMAVIANEQKVEQWRVEAPRNRAKLFITRLASLALDPNRDYELWALPDSGAAPVSLGLLPKGGKRDLQLSVAQRLALAGAS